MRTILIIIKHEIVTILRKPSFWIMTFLFPGIILILSVGMQTVGTRAIQEAEESATSIEQTGLNKPIGYVDETGLLETLPDWVPSGYLEPYSSEKMAKSALATGAINKYYFIPHDFFATGNVILIDSDFQPLKSSGNAQILETILKDALIEMDPLGTILEDPTGRINAHAMSQSSGLSEDDPLSFAVPMATLFIFFFVITTSSGFMLTSVTKEKENRTAETLLVSLEPRQLMLGKVVGLGAIALFQMSIWFGGSLLTLRNSNALFSLASTYVLPTGFIFWAILFFFLGYFLYASILGSIGVLAPNAREGGQFTFIAILPLLIPLWFNYSFTESPDGPVSVFLSLFPLTAPSSMITRLTTGNVPLWHLLLSIIGLFVSTYLFILLASRLFRADNLLSNDSLSWSKLFRKIRGI
jgi:ABC-2 type transport system permease protein